MVRLLNLDDAAAYVRLRKLMLIESPWAFGSSPEHDRNSNVEHVTASLRQPWFAIAGAIRDGELVSAAILNREQPLKRAHIAFIYSMFTHPSARRQGLGRSVLSELIRLARTWPGVSNLQLSVSDRSAQALALYESLGFAAWGREPDALRIGDGSAAEIHMILRF